MMRAGSRVAGVALLLAAAQTAGCGVHRDPSPVSLPSATPSSTPQAAPTPPVPPASPDGPLMAASPLPTFPGNALPPVPGRVPGGESPRVHARRLSRTLDAFLAVYGGRTTLSVRDLTTGRRYRYHHALRLPTASASKVGILAALLLETRWRDLGRRARSDARKMIRFSDNGAADRLYERIGMENGLDTANRRLGLRRTHTPGGRCVDLYCWGITQTTAEDQTRLVRALATDRSPLAPAKRRRVLGLMERVTPDQKWGISAGACEGDRVALKNGWLRHVANGRWGVVSAGLIRGHGHDYAVAVLTEDSPSMGAGIARIEGAVERVMAAFRGAPGCRAGEAGEGGTGGERGTGRADEPGEVSRAGTAGED
ncbi:serine hydrolase [Streptosporangium sp. DT93]|uniref:serine hydrolase n=1 Tax=Streptosporangium sp. DT93 TaxID=3393428 RepID=UPI003CF55670